MRTAHVAGPLIGDVQACARCDTVLIDNRGLAVGTERWVLEAVFLEGQEVIKDGHLVHPRGVVVRSGVLTMDEMRIEALIEPAPTPCIAKSEEEEQ